MQTYMFVFAIIAISGLGTFLSKSTSQEIQVHVGPGASKFISVQKPRAAPRENTGIIQHVTDWLNGEDTDIRVRNARSEMGSAFR